jgi:hypothetical protein
MTLKARMKWLKFGLFPLLLLVALGLFHWRWTWADPNYQADDAGFYLELSQEVQQVGTQHGWLKGLEFAYLHRHWKPILGPELIVPFLAISHGDTRQAFRMYSVTITTAMTFGLYYLYSALISDSFLAFLATLLTLVAPWLITDMTEFGSETPWVTSSVWMLGILLRSPHRPPRPTWPATLLLMVSVMLRPVESTLCLVLPYLICWLVPLWPDRRRFWQSIAIFAFEISAASALILRQWLAPLDTQYSLRLPELLLTAAGMLIYLVVKLIWLKRRGDEEVFRIHAQWTTMAVGVMIWFLPGLYTLISWILQCTNGQLVLDSPYMLYVKTNFIGLFLMRFGLLLLLPLALWPFDIGGVRGFWRERRATLLFLAWTVIGFALVGGFTNSRDFRYYHVSFIAALMLLLAITSRLKLARYLLKPLMLATLAVTAFTTLTLSTNDYFQAQGTPIFEVLHHYLIGDTSRLRRPEENKSFFVLYDLLKKYIHTSEISGVMIVPSANYSDFHATSALLYRVRSREDGRYWNVNSYMRTAHPHATDEELVSAAMPPGGFLVATAPVPAGEPGSDTEENRIARVLNKKCVGPPCTELGVEFVGGYLAPAAAFSTPQIYVIFKSLKPAPFRAPAADESPIPCYRGFSRYMNL